MSTGTAWTSRPDYTPDSQPPDRHGVIAHNANPSEYQQGQGGTIVPRAVADKGGGNIAKPKPPAIFVDPNNPETGEGGQQITSFSDLLPPTTAQPAALTPEQLAAMARKVIKQAEQAPPAPQPAMQPSLLHQPVQPMQEINVPAHTIPQFQHTGPPMPAVVLSTPEVPPANYAAIAMPFLTTPPSKPGVAVTFTMPQGQFRTKYHAAFLRGICLSLVMDNRYDGDQFIPAETGPGEVLPVHVPSLSLKANVVVMDIHTQIGCLDILNLLIRVDNDEEDTVEEAGMDAMVGHEDLMGG